MPIDIEWLNEYEKEHQRETKQKSRWPFPIFRTNKFEAPGEFTMRILPTHAEKNPRGFQTFNTNFISTSTKPVKKGEMPIGKKVLHPTALKDSHGPDAYWGFHDWLKELAEFKANDGELVVDKVDAFKTILTLGQMRRDYRVPVLIAAKEIPNRKIQDEEKRAKYPNLEALEGQTPMLDAIFEFSGNSAFGDQFIRLLKKHPNINDENQGFNIVFIKASDKEYRLELGEQIPLNQAQKSVFAGDRYPDMFESAKKMMSHDPDAIYADIKGSWWYPKVEKQLGITLKEHEVDLGFITKKEEVLQVAASVGADDI